MAHGQIEVDGRKYTIKMSTTRIYTGKEEKVEYCLSLRNGTNEVKGSTLEEDVAKFKQFIRGQEEQK